MQTDFQHLAVEFFMDAKLNQRKTREAGRPIYEDIEKVRIRIAGDPKTVLVALAHDQSSVREAGTNRRLSYAELHHAPYEAFKKGIAYVGAGTPLTELPFLTESKRRELAALNIHTAEALSDLDGANLARIGMGARELKMQAAAWLDKASGSADVTRLAGENEALKERLAEIERQMSALSGGGSMGEPAVRSEKSNTAPSPFEDWDDDTIRVWLDENGGGKPHHKCSHETLVAKADELNAALAERNKAA